jgi:hypothetical protein
VAEPIHYEDLVVSEYELGLTRLIGKAITEVRGYVADNGGGPVFKLTRIEFEDGTFLGVAGEYHFPYLVERGREPQPNYNAETLERLLDEADELGGQP